MQRLEDGSLAFDTAFEADVAGRVYTLGDEDGGRRYFVKQGLSEGEYHDITYDPDIDKRTRLNPEMAQKVIDSLVNIELTGVPYNRITQEIARACIRATEQHDIEDVPLRPAGHTVPLAA